MDKEITTRKTNCFHRKVRLSPCLECIQSFKINYPISDNMFSCTVNKCRTAPCVFFPLLAVSHQSSILCFLFLSLQVVPLNDGRARVVDHPLPVLPATAVAVRGGTHGQAAEDVFRAWKTRGSVFSFHFLYCEHE